MRLRIKALLVTASAIVAGAGCEGPREISPVMPPGFPEARPAVAEGEGAQALGEQPAATVSANQKVQAIAGGSPPTQVGQPRTTTTGLTYETLEEGTGETAKSGQVVKVKYKGTLQDGTVFDSSDEFPTPIGIGKVIGGWDEGIPGMKVGERRKLTIPPPSATVPRAIRRRSRATRS